jgi:lipopolysaccharide transport system permease protein
MPAQIQESKTQTISPAVAVQPVLIDNAAHKSTNLFSSLWNLRQLIQVMVRRDLAGRFRGSVMGVFWTVINPLGHLILYTFLFSIVLKVRLGTDASVGNFAFYLMAGLLPWQALSEALLRATSVIHENENLVKRVVFPLEILPFVVVLSSMVSAIVAILLLAGAASIFLPTSHLSLVFLPLVIASQLLVVGGIAWWVASISVFLQDIKHSISLALSVWMYATPIVYPASMLPKKLHFMLWVNPMAGIVGDYRRVILQGLPPEWGHFAVYTTFGIVLWFSGYYFFVHTKKSFADVM